MTLGYIIKKYRDEHKMSMDAFSERSGISKAYISLLEKNKHPKTGRPIAPSIQCIKQVASGMNMDFNDLFSMLDGNVSLDDFSQEDDEQKQIFSKNLITYLKKNNKTQKEVAEVINVSPQTFNTWCQGIAIPRMGKIQRLADYFNISKSDLLNDNAISISSNRCVINVLGTVAAGIPIDAVQDIIDTEEIPEKMARTGTFFGLSIKGDSMEPKISNGDVVIVRQQNDAETGDIVIATINGNEATCKRLRKYKEGIELIPNNPSYEPLYFSNKEIEEKPVKIIGKVVELRAKF